MEKNYHSPLNCPTRMLNLQRLPLIGHKGSIVGEREKKRESN